MMPSLSKNNIQGIIAEAIQRSDRSVFLENYNKQSKAVITDLRKAGYIIVPEVLSDEMVTSATKILTDGRHRPREIVVAIYKKLAKPFVLS